MHINVTLMYNMSAQLKCNVRKVRKVITVLNCIYSLVSVWVRFNPSPFLIKIKSQYSDDALIGLPNRVDPVETPSISASQQDPNYLQQSKATVKI